MALATPRPAEAAGPCDLSVTASPREMVGDRDYVSRIRVVTNSAAPRLVASAGIVERVRPDGPSAFVADYYPPRSGAGRALVAALAGERCGFTEVLFGGGAAAPAPSLAVLLGADAVHADEEESVAVYLFALASDGRPWGGPAPRVSAAIGEVSPAKPLGRGAWRAQWRQPAGAPGTAGLTAQIAGGARLAASLARLPGTGASLALEPSRDRAVAGESEDLSVTVRVLDRAGNPTDAVEGVSGKPEAPVLEVEGGKIGYPTRTGPGTWVFPLYASGVLSDGREMAIAARAGPLAGSAKVALDAGPPASLSAHFADDLPLPGSRARGALAVVAMDTFGNTADASGVLARAARGEVGDPREAAPGWWALPYRPPAIDREGKDLGDDLVEIRLGDLTAQVPVRLSLPDPMIEVAPKAGMASRSRGLGPYAGAELLLWTRAGTEQVGLALDATGMGFHTDLQLGPAPGPLPFRSEARYLAVTASAAWRHRLFRRGWIRAEAGGGAALVRSDATLAAQPTLTSSGWAPAATASLAFGLRAWRGGPFLELRGGWIGDPRVSNLHGSMTSTSLALGYRFDAR